LLRHRGAKPFAGLPQQELGLALQGPAGFLCGWLCPH
jgi:hypothetical protein